MSLPASDPLQFRLQSLVGHGSFGRVYISEHQGERVAVKKVLQDRRFKNRELDIMLALQSAPHPCVLRLLTYFHEEELSRDTQRQETFLCLVMDFYPETLHSVLKTYVLNRQYMPLPLVFQYMFQLTAAMDHIHSLGICHRDIKPHNLLVNPSTYSLVLCDFGSAKMFRQGEPNVAYICSRFYRAPELVLGFSEYDTSIDIWSSGCVLGEMMLGHPMFPGTTSLSQFEEIVKVLGFPDPSYMSVYNHSRNPCEYLAKHKRRPWNTLFRSTVNATMMDLIDQMLLYKPSDRSQARDLLFHPAFDIVSFETRQVKYPDYARQHQLRMNTPGLISSFTNKPDEKVPPQMSTDASSKTANSALRQSAANVLLNMNTDNAMHTEDPEKATTLGF